MKEFVVKSVAKWLGATTIVMTIATIYDKFYFSRPYLDLMKWLVKDYAMRQAIYGPMWELGRILWVAAFAVAIVTGIGCVAKTIKARAK